MNERDFLELCRQEVCKYTNKHLDKSDNKEKLLLMMCMLCGVVKLFKITKHYLVLLCLMVCIMNVHIMVIKKKCM